MAVRSTALVCLALWLCTAASALTCRDLYVLYEKQGHASPLTLPSLGGAFEPVLGKFVKSTAEGNVYLLGGHSEGKVYRIVPHDPKKPAYALKEFGNPRLSDPVLPLKLLRDLPGAKGFDVPKVEEIDDKSTESLDGDEFTYVTKRMRLEDVPGRDLHSLLMADDKEVPPAVKKQLRQDYNEYTIQLAKAVRAAGGKIDFDRPGGSSFTDHAPDELRSLLAYLKAPNGRSVFVAIKSDNIIVHYDKASGKFRMSIVDPV